MAVERRQDSAYWYGRWQENNRRFCKRLNIRVAGEPGSDAYEASREAAEQELEKFLTEKERRDRPEDLVQRLHEVKFGKRIGSILLRDIFTEWQNLPRKRAPSKGWETFAKTNIERFVEYIAHHHCRVTEMAGVTPEMAEAYMRGEEKRGVSPKTYNEMLVLLRGVFERLRARAGLLTNPFKESLVLKEAESEHRQPFTVEELERLFAAAQKHDSAAHGLIVTGACTALRLGDCCCLKWEDVDLRTNRIRVRTRKTGEKVAIPILPRLRSVLENTPRNGSPFVFPSFAESYVTNDNLVNRRLNRVFVLAGLRMLTDEEAKELREKAPVVIEIPEDDDLRSRLMSRLNALTPADVSPRIKGAMIQVFDLYSSGMTLPDIAKQLDISKGSISNYLARIEKIAGHPIVRKQIERAKELMPLAAAKPETGAKDPGKRLVRVNSRGFHALRATFTTHALAAGVPVEIVKMITGHTLTDTVLKHYFNPDEKTVYKTVEKAMPHLLTGGGAEAEPNPNLLPDKMIAIIDATTPKTWKADAAGIRKIAMQLKARLATA